MFIVSNVESYCAIHPTVFFSGVFVLLVECESEFMLTGKQANVGPVGHSLLEEMCCYGQHFAEVNSFCRGQDQIFCLLSVIL